MWVLVGYGPTWVCMKIGTHWLIISNIYVFQVLQVFRLNMTDPKNHSSLDIAIIHPVTPTVNSPPIPIVPHTSPIPSALYYVYILFTTFKHIMEIHVGWI